MTPFDVFYLEKNKQLLALRETFLEVSYANCCLVGFMQKFTLVKTQEILFYARNQGRTGLQAFCIEINSYGCFVNFESI